MDWSEEVPERKAGLVPSYKVLRGEGKSNSHPPREDLSGRLFLEPIEQDSVANPGGIAGPSGLKSHESSIR